MKTCAELGQSVQNLKIGGASVAIGLTFALVGAVAQAQQQSRIPKIGFLGARPAAPGSGYELFRQEIRKLGYVEDKNIAIEARHGENQLDRLPDPG